MSESENNIDTLTHDPEDSILIHHGMKGMHWGIRRYQNKDGSLTPEGRKRYMKDAKFRSKYENDQAKKRKTEEKKQESASERHSKLTKSSNPNELYNRRNELSNDEIRERIERIKLEQELSRYVKHEPTKQEKAQQVFDATMANATKVGNFLGTPGGKMIVDQVKKSLGIEDPTKTTDYDKFIRNISGMSDKQVSDMATRIKNENVIRSTRERLKESENNKDKPNEKEKEKETPKETTNNTESSNQNRSSEHAKASTTRTEERSSTVSSGIADTIIDNGTVRTPTSLENSVANPRYTISSEYNPFTGRVGIGNEVPNQQYFYSANQRAVDYTNLGVGSEDANAYANRAKEYLERALSAPNLDDVRRRR